MIGRYVSTSLLCIRIPRNTGITTIGKSHCFALSGQKLKNGSLPSSYCPQTFVSLPSRVLISLTYVLIAVIIALCSLSGSISCALLVHLNSINICHNMVTPYLARFAPMFSFYRPRCPPRLPRKTYSLSIQPHTY